MSLASSALMVEANEKIVELEEKITRLEKVNAEFVHALEQYKEIHQKGAFVTECPDTAIIIRNTVEKGNKVLADARKQV